MDAPKSMRHIRDDLLGKLDQLGLDHPGIAHELSLIREDIEHFTTSQIEQGQRLAKIGAALGAERDIKALLEMILLEAMRLNSADGGTFYAVKTDSKGNPISLEWMLTRNGTLKTWMGGTSGIPIPFPEIPLFVNGSENHSNVSAHVALSGETINLPDVYEAEGFDFQGPRAFDAKVGYRTKSMLVFPLRNHENEIVAVMQLINVIDGSGNIYPFASDNQLVTLSLATQAAVALTNAKLIISLENLFDAFIKAIAQSIDAKDDVTGGHIQRVAELTMMIARAINETNDGPFANIYFSQDELRELSIAAWLHDTGKITTPETVMFKSTKLEAFVDRVDNVKMRFELARCMMQIEAFRKKIEQIVPNPEQKQNWEEIDRSLTEFLTQNRDDWHLIERFNVGAEFLKPEIADRIKAIAATSFELSEELALNRETPYFGYLSRKTWEAKQEKCGPREEKDLPIDPSQRNLLTANELLNMLIARGTINDEERTKMEDHVVQTIKILEKLPFPRKMQNVPEYAGGHHEFLNGKGYPKHLNRENLPIQSKIMAVADIFEALSAADRPYKKAKPLSETLKIMGFMVKDGCIDNDIVNVFLHTGTMAKYAKEFIDQKQIDIELNEPQ